MSKVNQNDVEKTIKDLKQAVYLQRMFDKFSELISEYYSNYIKEFFDAHAIRNDA